MKLLFGVLVLLCVGLCHGESNVKKLTTERIPIWGGIQYRYSHHSKETNSTMRFLIYIPPKALKGEKAYVLYWLPGLLANEETVGGFGYTNYWPHAAKHNLIFVSTDSSPRGLHLPGERRNLFIGQGAGWYVDATQPNWKDHYRMHSYVTKELPTLIEKEFDQFVIPGRRSIMGHSMGGHGALVAALKNPGLFVSVSAFAPAAGISDINPKIPIVWGFRPLLGNDVEVLRSWDATYIVNNYKGPDPHILIDVGDRDPLTIGSKNFTENATNAGLKVDTRYRKRYSHVIIVRPFIREHFEHHAKLLQSTAK